MRTDNMIFNETVNNIKYNMKLNINNRLFTIFCKRMFNYNIIIKTLLCLCIDNMFISLKKHIMG